MIEGGRPRRSTPRPRPERLRRPHRERAGPPGYTLIEVLVAVVLVTVIAVALVPTLARGRAADRVARADTELKALTDALDTFADDVGEWPSSLTQLVTPLVLGDADICGLPYTGGERGGWAGPYLTRPLADGGLPAGIGVVDATLTLVPGVDINFLHVTVTDVEEGDASTLNARVDGDDDATDGAVRWADAGDGQVTLTWRMPIHTC